MTKIRLVGVTDENGCVGLTRDVYFDELVVEEGTILKTNGFRVFSKKGIKGLERIE